MRTHLKEHAAAEVEKLQTIIDSYRNCRYMQIEDFKDLCESAKALWMRLVALEEAACLNRSD